MTSQEFKAALLAKSPHYANSNQPIFDALANKLQRSGQYSQFGALYELYIYGFFIGLQINSRIPLPERKHCTDFAKIGSWKRESAIINFILLIVFSRSEEIAFDWNELEHMLEKDIDEVLKNIVTFIEEYAHGGLCYIKEKYQNDELDESQYRYIDLLSIVTEQYEDVAVEEPQVEKFEDDAPEPTEPEVLNALIESGETSLVEFKSTLRVNLRTGATDKAMEHASMKTIAAFLNTSGGTLLIGVDDKKNILGLQTDFNSFGANKDFVDEFQKHIDNLLEGYFGNSVFTHLDISLPTIDEKIICVVKVKPSLKGEVMLKNKADNNKEEFYIRRSASSKALSASEMIAYIKSQWS